MSNKNFPRYTMSMYMSLEGILKAIKEDAEKAVNDPDGIDVELVKYLRERWIGAGGNPDEFPKSGD